MTDYVFLVDTSGSDPGGYDGFYSSLSSCLLDIQGDIYLSGDTVSIECKDSVGGNPDDTSHQSLEGSNWPNPPDSLTIKPALGHEATGTWDTNKYTRAPSAGYMRAYFAQSTTMDIYIERLQIEVKFDESIAVQAYNFPGHVFSTQRCHVKKSSTGIGGNGILIGGWLNDAGTEIAIINNIVEGPFTAAIKNPYYNTSATVKVSNNTMVGCDSGLDYAQAWGNDVHVFNNISQATLTSADSYDYKTYLQSRTPPNHGNNISGDASSWTTTLRNKTITVGADFSLAAGVADNGDAIGGGADKSSDSPFPITVDINGTTRSATPTIGAWEPVASGGRTIDGTPGLADVTLAGSLLAEISLSGEPGIAVAALSASLDNLVTLDADIALQNVSANGDISQGAQLDGTPALSPVVASSTIINLVSLTGNPSVNDAQASAGIDVAVSLIGLPDINPVGLIHGLSVEVLLNGDNTLGDFSVDSQLQMVNLLDGNIPLAPIGLEGLIGSTMVLDGNTVVGPAQAGATVKTLVSLDGSPSLLITSTGLLLSVVAPIHLDMPLTSDINPKVRESGVNPNIREAVVIGLIRESIIE